MAYVVGLNNIFLNFLQVVAYDVHVRVLLTVNGALLKSHEQLVELHRNCGCADCVPVCDMILVGHNTNLLASQICYGFGRNVGGQLTETSIRESKHMNAGCLAVLIDLFLSVVAFQEVSHMVDIIEYVRHIAILLSNGCRIDAVGSGQKLRGRRNYERRPDLILCDDIENDEGVRTAEQRQKTADWFWKAVCKSGDSYTDILVIGTILHHDSLLAGLLENPGFQSRKYRAVLSDATSPLWTDWERLASDLTDPDREKTAHAFYFKHRKEMLAGAKVLWPEKLSYYDLRLMRLTEGDAAFNSEMQNQPIDPAACLFSAQWFRYYNPAEMDFRAADFRFYGYCDPSLGRTASSDYSAIVTLAVDRNTGLAYVWDADIQRRHPDKIIGDILEKERLLRRETGRGYALFGAETNQFQWFLKEQLARESARQGLYLPIQGVRSTEDKTMRVETLQPDVKNGYILFRRDQTLLLQQLSQFPLGAHDDGPDALEGARTLARKQSRTANLSGLHL